MLPWCLVRMSGMSVIVRPIQIRSEPRVSVRWPHPPPPIGCDSTSRPADGGLPSANPSAGPTPNIVGSSGFFSALKLWRFFDSAHIWMRLRFYLTTSPVSPACTNLPIFDQLFFLLLVVVMWRMQAYTTDVCTFTVWDTQTCWNVNVRTLLLFFYFLTICTCEHLLSRWMCFNTDCLTASWETECLIWCTLPPMQESIANLRRWTRERILTWCFYNHFITRITLHVFLRLISRFACQTSPQPAGGDRNVVTFPPRSCEM